MGTAVTRIRTQHELRTYVCKCHENTASFGMAISNPGPGIGFVTKRIVHRKFWLLESRRSGNLGNSSRRQRELRPTHQAPCGRISVREKRNWFTILYTYRCIIDKQFNLSLLHRKNQLAQYNFRINLFLLSSPRYNLELDPPPFDGS